MAWLKRTEKKSKNTTWNKASNDEKKLENDINKETYREIAAHPAAWLQVPSRVMRKAHFHLYSHKTKHNATAVGAGCGSQLFCATLFGHQLSLLIPTEARRKLPFSTKRKYIAIYICRERKRERERTAKKQKKEAMKLKDTARTRISIVTSGRNGMQVFFLLSWDLLLLLGINC